MLEKNRISACSPRVIVCLNIWPKLTVMCETALSSVVGDANRPPGTQKPPQRGRICVPQGRKFVPKKISKKIEKIPKNQFLQCKKTVLAVLFKGLMEIY